MMMCIKKLVKVTWPPQQIRTDKHYPVVVEQEVGLMHLHLPLGKATAGAHPNPFHLPKSACNAVTVSTDMVSQVLTSLDAALFEKALQGAFESVNQFCSHRGR